MSHTMYLVAYDISDHRRWYRVHKYLLGYKVAGQKSFFECWLTPADLRKVMSEVGELIDAEQDRAHIFQLDERMAVRCYGIARTFDSNIFMIV